MNAYLMQMVVQGPGKKIGFTSAVKFFETEDVAKKAVMQQNDQLAAICQTGKIVVQTEKGPRAVMSIQQFLGMCGITNVAANLVSGEVEGAVILTPASPLVLP